MEDIEEKEMFKQMLPVAIFTAINCTAVPREKDEEVIGYIVKQVFIAFYYLSLISSKDESGKIVSDLVRTVLNVLDDAQPSFDEVTEQLIVIEKFFSQYQSLMREGHPC